MQLAWQVEEVLRNPLQQKDISSDIVIWSDLLWFSNWLINKLKKMRKIPLSVSPPRSSRVCLLVRSSVLTKPKSQVLLWTADLSCPFIFLDACLGIQCIWMQVQRGTWKLLLALMSTQLEHRLYGLTNAKGKKTWKSHYWLEVQNVKLTFIKPVPPSAPNPVISVSSAQAKSPDVSVGFVCSHWSHLKN